MKKLAMLTLVVRDYDLLLWEDGDGMPRQLKFEETLAGNLTVKLVAFGYSAFTAGRYPKAVEALEAAAKKWPENNEAAYFLALGYEDVKKQGKAIAILREVKIGRAHV